MKIEKHMDALVLPLVSEKANHSDVYMMRVLDVFSTEEAVLDILGMIEHKAHSAVFCACCLMFLDVSP